MKYTAKQIPPGGSPILIEFKDWRVLGGFQKIIRVGHGTGNKKFPWFAHGYGSVEKKDIISWKYMNY